MSNLSWSLSLSSWIILSIEGQTPPHHFLKQKSPQKLCLLSFRKVFIRSIQTWDEISRNIIVHLYSLLLFSLVCYLNKHIHAKVVWNLAPIRDRRHSSALLRAWFIQPLTGGSLWTSEHIRRQTQEPSALIKSHHSMHGRDFPVSFPLSFSFSSLLHTFNHFLNKTQLLWLHRRHIPNTLKSMSDLRCSFSWL